jgi:hypothetical protein
MGIVCAQRAIATDQGQVLEKGERMRPKACEHGRVIETKRRDLSVNENLWNWTR